MNWITQGTIKSFEKEFKKDGHKEDCRIKVEINGDLVIEHNNSKYFALYTEKKKDKIEAKFFDVSTEFKYTGEESLIYQLFINKNLCRFTIKSSDNRITKIKVISGK